MKKLLALILAMLLCAGGALAETAFDKTDYPICDDVVTLSVVTSIWNETEPNDTYYVQEIEKRLGLRLQFTSYKLDVWNTQRTLIMASGELPDIIVNSQWNLAEANDYGQQGYFLPLNEYLDYMPNLRAYMEEFPMLAVYMTAGDGNMYAIPTLTINPIAQAPRVFLSKVWLDNVGMQAPQTLDELYAVLKAFKEQDANGNGDPNDELPLSWNGDITGYLNNVLLNAFGIYSNASHYILQQADGQVYAAETTDAYKAYLTFLHKLYAEGLLDAECFIQASDEFKAKAAADRVGFYGTSAPYVAAGKSVDYDANFIWSGAYTSEYQAQRSISMSGNVGSKVKLVVNAETEYPEIIARFIDYCYSDEGHIAGRWGFEGITYENVNLGIAGLEEYVAPECYKPEGYASAEEFRTMKALVNEGFNLLSLAKNTRYDAILHANEEQLEALLPSQGWSVLLTRAALNDPTVARVEVFPTLLYTDEESAIRSTIVTDLTIYLQNMFAQFVTGETDIEAGWADYLSTMNQMGLTELLEIEQNVYDRMMK